ncbi:4-hydroxythreonine-4-phosphate dehydrogenase [Parvibaculum lavamentivorans DS-1]|uniref:4-hydroxythreonine-4-phosphate dehydrogenase n=1 Tax=Parvibaculum lavamentivorans (strain DS-1 / DSM 13023 / NCIMB 13966) TaxID=402881 RepID=A7HYG3_PARL1|nr:4-hydroxythreonine-4-phosphate dehydrogenase PdxA [Parvibaculum lavamentivorans]ABS64946.1 4-hydroxythreonine-4-phosphate dehydrogenase [Parvibaculum lavamentivorans DS-1]
MTRDKAALPPLALSMGEPAGIGPEITLKAWAARAEKSLPIFFVAGDPALYRTASERLGAGAAIREISDPSEAAEVFPGALPVLPVPLHEAATPGQLSGANAAAVLASIDTACDAVTAGKASGLVTNPIHKRVLYDAGFHVPGHTEYLAERTGGAKPVMMLSCPGLRVVPVTVHLSLKDAVAVLTTSEIVEHGLILSRSLTADFGISKPRIAIAALNPHAGEEGHLGREEIDIIAPAAKLLAEALPGAEISGPLPADTLFHAAARARHDAVLCMYHDQALIPLKTIDFARGVNITLGLPIVRTSPDHGTALDIAGRGVADPESLIEAILVADEITRHRAGA